MPAPESPMQTRSIEEELRERLHFETLLADFSAAFISLPAGEVARQIDAWLERITQSLRIDRAAIVQFATDTEHAYRTHVFTRAGLPAAEPADGPLQPWVTAQLRRGERGWRTDLPDSLPVEAESERDYCIRQGLKSTLSIPMKIGGTLLGAVIFYSFDPAHQWPEPLLQRLELLGQIFANALHRHRTQSMAHESQRMYADLVNSIDGIVWEADAATFQFTFVSSKAERLLGYPVKQWLTEPNFWKSRIHADDRALTVDYCLQATQALKDHEFQYRMLAQDGRVVWVRDIVRVIADKGQPAKLRGIMVDITESHKVQEALRESEAHFRTIFEEAPIGLAYVDSSFRIRKCNRALCRFLGYTEPELHNVSFVDITHPDDVEKDAQLAGQVFRREIENYQLEKRYLKKGGEIVWGLLTVTMLRDKDGQVVNILGMVENISSRKEIEDQLRQSQKMDAFGQLAGGVAHDFNNLIMAINAYSEISLAQLPATEGLRANLEEIIQAGTRAAALTRQLLAFSRKQALRPKVIDLGNVVDNLNKMLRRMIGENIKLVTSVEGKLGKVLADPSQIEQIIVNLAVNARDAMPKGGKLMIELSSVYLDKEYARYHLAVTPGQYVMLAVSDTGCGMSKAVQQRIFEPFFTTKEVGKGTGLGLSTVYGIVKQSGGDIWVYSEEGVGTKFKIYLPRVDQPAEDDRARIEVKEPVGGTETILLVEDDDVVRNVILRILRARGYDVLVAREGREALLLAEQHSRAIQLLLTDVIMPKMGGRELYEELRRKRPQMKVLYMSGYSGDSIVHHGVLDEGIMLIEKPFTMDELLTRLRELFAG